MFKPGSWINRKRHNRGFGIQSPSAFFFITQVLREKLPYYAYDELDDIACRCHGIGAGKCREIFRIANYFSPSSAIVIESVTAACAIGSARRNIPQCLISEKGETGKEPAAYLEKIGCRLMKGNPLQLMEREIKENGHCGILYLGECCGRGSLLECAMHNTNKESIIIVEGIHQSKEAEELWQHAIESPLTIVTYDMYSYGILLFNNEKQKQNYTLKR